jgi:predicted nuclease with TOPRIM domain
MYGLRYDEFVVPLVKAIQEQQVIIEDDRAKISTLESEHSSSEVKIKSLQEANVQLEKRLKAIEEKLKL